MSADLAFTLHWEGHKVRMVGRTDRPEWVARDVCRALDIHNSRSTLESVVPAEAKGVHSVDTPGGPQSVATVLEGGLWRLVARSRKPSARKFQAWIFDDVLPSIRKHGRYPPPSESIVPAFDLRDPAQLLAAALQLTQIVGEQREALAVAAPKVEAHDRLSAARGDVCLQEAARILGRKPNVFVATLLDDGILFRGAHHRPEPRAEYRERGYFRERISEVHGEAFGQTLVTPRGLQWLAKRYPREDRSGEFDAPTHSPLGLPPAEPRYGDRVINVLAGGAEAAGQMISETAGRFVHAVQQQLSISLVRHGLTIASLAAVIDSYPEGVQQQLYALAVELHPAAAGRLN